MPHHVFIVMPFGTKEGIDFNKIYSDLIKPALEEAGLEPFRADEEIMPGDIRADMFQELLMADLVVADLSINNPNAWYELGVRHGLRARGIVQIRSNESGRLPFDVSVDRTIKYHLKEGIPDADFLDQDKALLGSIAQETLQSWKGKSTSPVYQYLPYLKEPDWKSLRVGKANEFWDQYEKWQSLIDVAQKKSRPGDILVLAEEASTNALQLEAYRSAGSALLELGQFTYALEQIEKALEMDENDLSSAQMKAIILGRLGRMEEAEEWLGNLLEDHPEDAETWALYGRLEKERWVSSWKDDSHSPDQMKQIAIDEAAQLSAAVNAYRQGFLVQPDHTYSGINALALSMLKAYLLEAGEDEEWVAMEGALRWSLNSELAKEKPDNKNFWARITLADLNGLTRDEETVKRAYKHAVIAARDDWFKLNSTRQQLQSLNYLGFRPVQVKAALSIVDHELEKIEKPIRDKTPRKVFLFSGHMIDAPNRTVSRFPADKEAIVRAEMEKVLQAFDAGSEDLAISSGACGGDLIFAEACLERGVKLELKLPFDIPEFLERSVNFAGNDWQKRFFKIKDHANTTIDFLEDELGKLPAHVNPYERCNKWMLYTAISWGAEKVNFICLWDGKGGDGPGGTKHMLESVRQRSGRVTILDTETLFAEG